MIRLATWVVLLVVACDVPTATTFSFSQRQPAFVVRWQQVPLPHCRNLLNEQGAPRRTYLSSRSMASSSSDEAPREDSDNMETATEEEDLTLPKIAELIDCSFVQACMQLAEGYVDILKLMITSIRSAYQKDISPVDLIQALDDIQPGSAGRMLVSEEVRLRNTWIQVVYVMLACLEKKQQHLPVLLDPDIEESYVPIAPILMRRKELDSHSFNAKELYEATAQFFPHSTTNDSNPFEEAIVLQSLRVMWVTMTVVDEVELCEGEFARADAKLKKKPQPPIPGAFD